MTLSLVDTTGKKIRSVNGGINNVGQLLHWHQQLQNWKVTGNILYEIHFTWIKYFYQHNQTQIHKYSQENNRLVLEYFEVMEKDGQMVQTLKEGKSGEEYNQKRQELLSEKVSVKML